MASAVSLPAVSLPSVLAGASLDKPSVGGTFTAVSLGTVAASASATARVEKMIRAVVPTTSTDPAEQRAINDVISIGQAADFDATLYGTDARIQNIRHTTTTYLDPKILASMRSGKDRTMPDETITNSTEKQANGSIRGVTTIVTADTMLNTSPAANKAIGERSYFTERTVIKAGGTNADGTVIDPTLAEERVTTILTADKVARTFVRTITTENSIRSLADDSMVVEERVRVERFSMARDGTYLWDVRERYLSATTNALGEVIAATDSDVEILSTMSANLKVATVTVASDTSSIAYHTNGQVDVTSVEVQQSIILEAGPNTAKGQATLARTHITEARSNLTEIYAPNGQYSSLAVQSQAVYASTPNAAGIYQRFSQQQLTVLQADGVLRQENIDAKSRVITGVATGDEKAAPGGKPKVTTLALLTSVSREALVIGIDGQSASETSTAELRSGAHINDFATQPEETSSPYWAELRQVTIDESDKSGVDDAAGMVPTETDPVADALSQGKRKLDAIREEQELKRAEIEGRKRRAEERKQTQAGQADDQSWLSQDDKAFLKGEDKLSSDPASFFNATKSYQAATGASTSNIVPFVSVSGGGGGRLGIFTLSAPVSGGSSGVVQQVA